MEAAGAGHGPPPACGGPHEAATAGEATAAVLDELTRLSGLLAEDAGPRPFAVVADDDRVLAGNRPLFELLGCHEPDILGGAWSLVMPEWRERGAAECLRTRLRSPCRPDDDRGVPVLVDVRPIVAGGGRVVAHTLLLYPAADRLL